MNRIQQAYTTGPNWGETYTIDSWGNLTNRAPVSGKTMSEPLNAAALTNNRLVGFAYDAAGNLTYDGLASYLHDGENRIIYVAPLSGSPVTYTYDGDGNRVKKSGGTLYWRDGGGNVISESDLTGAAKSEYMFFNDKRIARRDLSGGTVYYFSDQLGSASVITTATGTMPPVEESDYYPYGGEIVVSGSNPNHYKFTGKERDSESGLDNFGARYNASTMGRFMTPDPIHIMKQKFLDPQQWNMYAYVRNNPLRFVDPTGKYLVNCGDGDKKCNKAADKFEKQREKDLKSKDLKVQDAAKAWGNRGEDDHVNVTFKPQAQVDADAHTAPGYTTQAFVRPGAGADRQPNIQAEFSESLGGSSLGQVIAHEGSHIEDDMSFLNSYNGATGKYNPGLNFTHFDTEFQAFEAGSGVKSYSEFQRGPKGYQQLDDYIYRAYPNADDLVFPPAVFPQ